MTGVVAATIADVADRAGVSTATVSRILSGVSQSRPVTRARVLDAVKQLDYRPSGIARSLKLRQTKTLGLIITDIQNPYFPALVRGVEDATWERGYAVLLCSAAQNAEREAYYLELLAERRVDGIIVAASRIGARHEAWLANPPVPVVLVNCEVDVPGVPAILSDNRTGGRLAADHLLELGHRRIAHVAGPPSEAAAEPRLAGVRDALVAAGLDPAKLAVEVGDGHVSGGQRATGALLEAVPGLTGIVCYNDLTAVGALLALRRRGVAVPYEMSVVGFDDLELASYVDPPLTTISQETRRMARWAVERLARTLDGGGRNAGPEEDGRAPEADDVAGTPDASDDDDEPDDDEPLVVRLPVTLCVRGSTAPPRP